MHMTNFKVGFALATSLALAALPNAATAQGIIKIAEQWNVRTGWDMASDDAYLGARAGCYEGLTRVDFDSKVAPSLAVSWAQPSPNVWEFTLRDGVKFQDGTAFTAETAANALNNLLKAPVPARAFSPKLVKSVEAVGDKMVRITTVEPSVLLPGQMASPATTILAPAAYKDGKVNPLGNCTGPFTITRVDPSQSMSLKRNDNYWGKKAVLAGAEIRFITDANGRATQARTGEADIARLVPPWTLSQLKSTPGLKLAEVNAPRTTMMLLNNKRAPFDDVRVRRAIQAAIDNAGIAAAVYEGAAPAAVGPFRPSDPWAPKDQKPAYNLELAKKLLAEAGVKPGTLKLTLLAYSSRTELKDVGTVVQDQLKAVGIQVDVKLAEYNAIEPDLLSGNFDMTFMSRGYLTDVPEPAGYFNADYACGGSFNISHYCTPEVDAEIKQIFATPEQAQRFDQYRNLASKLQSDAITVFIVNETLYDAYSSKVKNYKAHPISYSLLTPELSMD
jgi:peptide/nickel transport system substrate-binding protein